MGRKTVKFIDKSKSQHFYLLNRSQTDEAYSKDGVPSDFVLVPAEDSQNKGGRSNTDVGKLLAQQDHITPLGFLNDGYDYSQHLKELGSGVFISKTGVQMSTSVFSGKKINEFDLPSDVFSSGVELPRGLEAITISHDLMDDDIRAALFEDTDENGEAFEELLDDFVTDAMGDNLQEPDFDFNAHIAQLISRSENIIAPIKSRNWNNNEIIHEEDGDESYEHEDDISDYGPVVQLSKAEKDVLDKQFENTFAEYDDAEIGYLSQAESEDVDGTIDLDADNMLLDQALDDFIRSQEEDAVGKEVPKVGKKDYKSIQQKLVNVSEPPLEIREAFEKEEALQQQAVASLPRHCLPRSAGGDVDPALEVCQEYLREVRLESEWDCETVLSTYSTLDNHPTLIADPLAGSGGRRHSRRPQSTANNNNNLNHSSISSTASVSNRSTASNSVAPSARSSGYIRYDNITPRRSGDSDLSATLSKEMARIKATNAPSSSSSSSTPAAGSSSTAGSVVFAKSSSTTHRHRGMKIPLPATTLATIEEEAAVAQLAKEGTNDDDEAEEATSNDDGADDDDEEEDDDDNDDDGNNLDEKKKVLLSVDGKKLGGGGKGFKHESAEEKKLRKNKVKEDKRLRRVVKKASRQATRLDDHRSHSQASRSLELVSVYKY